MISSHRVFILNLAVGLGRAFVVAAALHAHQWCTCSWASCPCEQTSASHHPVCLAVWVTSPQFFPNFIADLARSAAALVAGMIKRGSRGAYGCYDIIIAYMSRDFVSKVWRTLLGLESAQPSFPFQTRPSPCTDSGNGRSPKCSSRSATASSDRLLMFTWSSYKSVSALALIALKRVSRCSSRSFGKWYTWSPVFSSLGPTIKVGALRRSAGSGRTGHACSRSLVCPLVPSCVSFSGAKYWSLLCQLWTGVR